ncbi:MAG: cyanophycin synthetase [Tatlockia sp.]
MLPSLFTHRCSKGVDGGFFERLDEGTWLGHIIEHVALELQCLAGMDCGFGRTRSASETGVYYVVIAYQVEKAGFYAAEAALKLVQALALNQDYKRLPKDIQHLKKLHEEAKLGPSTQALVKEAKQRNIPVFIDEKSTLITLGHGLRQKKIWATISSSTSTIGVDIAADKELTKQMLQDHFIPVPKGVVVDSLQALQEAVKTIGFPLVIKPKTGNHGRGVTTNIVNQEKLLAGFEQAKKISDEVIVERFIEGDDYRMLVVDYKVVAVARRMRAMVVGTGKHSIEELIALANQDPKRGKDHENVLTTIEIDDNTQTILQAHNLTLESILPHNHILYLKDTANLSSGGTATDVTDEVHSENLRLAERVARLVGLDICGIDVVAQSVCVPITLQNGAILEVNASPGLRMHLAPCQGKARNVAAPILDLLFPKPESATIPIVGVTGTNGKTTVVRLIATMAKMANHCVGSTTTDGIYLDGKLIFEGDCSGPVSAETILREPSVNFAVLECARGGLLRQGLGFHTCDISVITNISADHLGIDGVHTLEHLARIKGVLARSTKEAGYAILNADDEMVYGLKEQLSCNIALFGKEKSERIRNHCNDGGLAVYLDKGWVVIQNGCFQYQLMEIVAIPLTYHGAATSMIQNLLPAVLTGFLSNFSFELIKSCLQNFYPTASNLPGRMNLFHFANCQIMVDYAHNEAAFYEVGQFINTIHCDQKIGIIGVPGDRRAEDIEKMGTLAAQCFDEIIIRHDKDGRGRSNEEITALLISGIHRFSPQRKISIISDELEAIQFAMQNAAPNAFIFHAVEGVFRTIEFLENRQKMLKLPTQVTVS